MNKVTGKRFSLHRPVRLTEQADGFSQRATVRSWDALRDWLDLETGSDLDATRLDILTDMVWARVHHARTVE